MPLLVPECSYLVSASFGLGKFRINLSPLRSIYDYNFFVKNIVICCVLGKYIEREFNRNVPELYYLTIFISFVLLRCPNSLALFSNVHHRGQPNLLIKSDRFSDRPASIKEECIREGIDELKRKPITKDVGVLVVQPTPKLPPPRVE